MLQLLFQMPKSRRSGICVLMQPLFLTFKEGPAQPPQGVVLQNPRTVLCIKVKKAPTKAKGKKMFVCLLSRGYGADRKRSKLLTLFYCRKENILINAVRDFETLQCYRNARFENFLCAVGIVYL